MIFNWSEKKNGTSLHVTMKNLVREKTFLIPVNKLLFLAYSTSFIKGGSAPGFNPSPFYNIMFDRKGTLFVYLPLQNSTSLTYLINRINRYKGKFSFHFPVTFNKPKSHDGLLGTSYPEPWERHTFRMEPLHIGYYREYPLFLTTHILFFITHRLGESMIQSIRFYDGHWQWQDHTLDCPKSHLWQVLAWQEL